MDPVLIMLSAGVKLWAEVREGFDKDIRRAWDLMFLGDVIELRKRLGMPLPPGLDIAALLAAHKEGAQP